jgi:metal-dependent amidase/aminoacylase/carboxypeptidase family protein
MRKNHRCRQHAASHHNNHFHFDEVVLALGVELAVLFVAELLR